MGDRRHKIHKGLGDYVPLSVNFSDINNVESLDNRNFDPGDNGLEEQRLYDTQSYEEMVMSVLNSLSDREKLVFVFQLLRDSGFQIDHGSFAKVIELSRRQYMRILDDVRFKTELVIKCYNTDSHKE